MGTAAELGRAFEDWLNKKYARGHLRQNVIFVPMRRDKMLRALVDGEGDIVAANLTITPERLAIVDFAPPALTDVKEIVVTGPQSPQLASLDDLAGQEVRVRPSSSYASHLALLNDSFRARKIAPMRIRDLPEDIEDEDLLEMVSAGIVPFAVVDQHKAQVWGNVFPALKMRPDLVINAGGDIAWAFRKNSPKLKSELDAFFKEHRVGTSFGNTLLRRYFGGTKAVKPAVSATELKKFSELASLFQRYGKEYGFEYLMLAAQGYQESTLDQTKRSPRGAVGVMQLLPKTAAAPPIGMTGVDRDVDANIHAGAAYMRYLRETYLNAPDMKGMNETNRTLMTFAAYNAGPGNLRKFRKDAVSSGNDPNIWFENVEQSAAKIVGRETVQYVSNIYKYYLAYQLALERSRDAAEAGEREKTLH